MNEGRLFEFKTAPETEDLREVTVEPQWKVLSVEDDANYQASLKLALEGLRVRERQVQMLTAASAAEAASLLAANPDIALVLLDVVMESDDAGLRLVTTIREVIGNQALRIVLLTGQPGMAPEQEVMRRYDIDDYWCKTEIGQERLTSVVANNLRTWDHLTQLEQSRQGLAMVVEASRALAGSADFQQLAVTVLDQIGRILEIDSGGISCIRFKPSRAIGEAEVIAANGCYAGLCGRALHHLEDPSSLALLERACAQRGYLEEGVFSVFYCAGSDEQGPDYLTLVRLQRPLTEAQQNLLRVFTENISTSFTNVTLLNRLTELAYWDPTFRVLNRNGLLLELNKLPAPVRLRSRLAVVMVDDFHDMVLTLGEGFLDQVLVVLIGRLKQAWPTAPLARFHRGGLAMLLDEDGLDVAVRFTELREQSLSIDGVEHGIFTTVAVVPLADVAELDHAQLLSLAERAIGTARREGISYREVSPRAEQRRAERFTLLRDLRAALHQHRLFMMLQPKVRLDDGALVGFEALVRWRREGQLVPPDQFIPLAETSGLIAPLGRQVITLACGAVKQLGAAGVSVPVAFNASGGELVQSGYFDMLSAMIQEAGVLPNQLDLEVTETQAMQDYERIAPGLERLIDLGMGVSIDDFGTGYSSLAYISRLKATCLKIDRAFVNNIEHSVEDRLVAEMVLRLGERFGFKVVAEGVETEAQRQLLRALGCPLAQGYLFARPMAIDEAIAWAKRR